MSASVLVLKFGGTSLGSAACVRAAARRVLAIRARGLRPVVVASANGRATDRILRRLAGIGGDAPDLAREADRALATGEDLSAALLAAALLREGAAARSLRGGEAGVRAEGSFGEGVITAVDPGALWRLLDAGVIPVVSGFQGLRSDGETVTLGRGGSDTSAVAIAAALRAPCHIVTDVDAVYDRDPRHHPDARPFTLLEHAALLRIAQSGGQVVHPTAAELALRHGVPLRIYHFRAPLSGRGGTRVGSLPTPVTEGAA